MLSAVSSSSGPHSYHSLGCGLKQRPPPHGPFSLPACSEAEACTSWPLLSPSLFCAPGSMEHLGAWVHAGAHYFMRTHHTSGCFSYSTLGAEFHYLSKTPVTSLDCVLLGGTLPTQLLLVGQLRRVPYTALPIKVSAVPSKVGTAHLSISPSLIPVLRSPKPLSATTPCRPS